ncbi:MAG: response regulator [Imperialibacter sp.]|uniref:response regulator n=1 Tax=Imperialibacter sp. TaxID=2038411 RepID=UPI003A89F59F
MQKGRRIFLIDDDEIFLMISTVNLKTVCSDVEILTATNGQEGLLQLNSAQPNVILLDVNMPVMGGWEFLEKLSGAGIGVNLDFPIYITTSSVDPEDKRRAQLHPLVKGFIEKPLTAEKIREMEIC